MRVAEMDHVWPHLKNVRTSTEGLKPL